MDLLNVEEAKSFLEDILKIEKVPLLPVSLLKANERLELLNKIILAFYDKVPFQCITLMSFDVDKRHRRSWEDIKEDMFTSQGGVCYSMHAFMFALLAALGYEAKMAHSTVFCGDVTRDNHLVVLVHDTVVPGDQFLVEVGCGYPILQAISLDFALESPEYTYSFQTFKYVKESNERIVLKLKKPILSTTCGESTEQVVDYQWKPYYNFNPLEESTRLEDFYNCFDDIFKDIRKLPLQTSPRSFYWPVGKFLGIVDSTLLVEDERAKLVKTDLRLTSPHHGSDEARGEQSQLIEGRNDETDDSGEGLKEDPLWDLKVVRQHYSKIFPQFSQELVTAALKNWKITGTLTKVPEDLV